MGWSDEDKKVVRDLWMEGYTTEYIGIRMGKTANSISGLVNRMGLMRSKRAANPLPNHPARRYSGRLKALLGHKRSDGSEATVVNVPMPEPSVAAKNGYRRDGKLLSLMELRRDTCRWPVGDPLEPKFGFCGAQTGHGPYCVIHRKIATSHFARRV